MAGPAEAPAVAPAHPPPAPPPPPRPPASLWDVADPIPLLDGGTLALADWRGFPVLIVNTASLCGYTAANYAGLSRLATDYRARGLRVLGFPCAQFGGQEHADPRDTRAAADRAGVSFPLAARVDVAGPAAHPVFRFVAGGDDAVAWNFEKFLVGKDGRVVARWRSEYDDGAIRAAVERELGSV